MGGMHIVYKQEVVRQPLVNSESRNLDFLGVLAAQTVAAPTAPAVVLGS